MNKHNLGIISTLVAIALVTLIAVQIYWIKSSIKLKEEEFERSVKEALKSTANKLEKIATANKIAKKIKLRKQGVRITKPGLVTVGNPSGSDVFRPQAEGYLSVLVADRHQHVRPEPFDALEVKVGVLLGDDPEP